MKNYSFSINSCGITDCSPEWHWETAEHGFDDYDLWAVFRGRGEISVDGKLFLSETGDCFLLPPGCAIVGRHHPEDPLLVMNVHFSIWDGSSRVCDLPFSKRYISDQRFFEKLLQRVISAHYKNNSDESLLWFKAVIEEYISYPDDDGENKVPRMHAQCVEKMCKRINESSAQSTSLEAFANEFGYSPSHLGRIFHKITGVSFSRYLMNARINQAKLLLRTSDMTVNEISLLLGYYDSGHFIKQFKQIAGKTPKDYRNIRIPSKIEIDNTRQI